MTLEVSLEIQELREVLEDTSEIQELRDMGTKCARLSRSVYSTVCSNRQ